MTSYDQHREWDARHVWHPFTSMPDYRAEFAPVIVAADGFELVDADGKRYLDGHSSLWCNLHGHRVPQIDAAIRSQLDRVAHTTQLGLANDVAAEFAHELALHAPGGLDRVFFSDDGSTAVEAALKIAFQYHRQKLHPEPRDVFVSLSGAYHGDTLGAVSVGRFPRFHQIFSPLLFPILSAPTPVGLHHPPGISPEAYIQYAISELESVLRTQAERIAALIIEPRVQAAAGMLVHPSGYLRRVRDLTKELGILLIADEVATGFGRTGTLWACDQEQVVPDFLCLSKAITGGYLPLAATIVTDEIEGAFNGLPWEGRQFFHGHTYSGNPLGCAAGLASLRLIDSNRVLENGHRVAELLAAGLSQLTKHPNVAEVRQCGTMVGVEFAADRSPLAPFPAEKRIGHWITIECRRRGLITRNIGDTLVLMPAPAMPVELVERITQITVESIEAVMLQRK